MKIPKVADITSEEDARQLAMDWQNDTDAENISYGELALWGVLFTELADKYGLREEFEENGII